MPEKSTTCFGKVSGQPLTVYRSRGEADNGADYVSRTYDRPMVAYACDRCSLWHIAPSDRQTASVQSGCCTGRNGQPKAAYDSEAAALRRAEILQVEQGVDLTAYACPHGGGWHLTKG